MQTGAFTQLGTVSGISAGDIGDVARLPGGLLYGIDANSRLVLIDPVALTTSVVGASGNSIFGLAFRPDGTLFGLSLNNHIYTIDPGTGAATSVALLTGFPGIQNFFDIKFDNAGHTWVLSHNVLYTVNLSTGVVTSVGSIGFNVYALDFENGVLYSFTTDGKILTIDTTTGAGTVAATETQTSPIVAASTGGVSVGAPRLTIQPTNTASFALTWVAPSNYFRLQENQDLSTTNWTAVSNSVSMSNSLNQVVVSPSVSNDFFRLIHP